MVNIVFKLFILKIWAACPYMPSEYLRGCKNEPIKNNSSRLSISDSKEWNLTKNIPYIDYSTGIIIEVKIITLFIDILIMNVLLSLFFFFYFWLFFRSSESSGNSFLEFLKLINHNVSQWFQCFVYMYLFNV